MSVAFTNKENQALRVYAKTLLNPKSAKSSNICYPIFLHDKLLLAYAVKKGVTMALFKEIKNNSPFDDQEWSVFLNINLRTLQRYKKNSNHIFKPIQSEKVFELAEVVHKGCEVFDSPEDFTLWLRSPSAALCNEVPINLLDTSYGKDLVLSELNNIEYGLFV